MRFTVKCILSFPALFTPKKVKDASGQDTGEAKYSAVGLLEPTHPQIPVILAAINTAKQDTFPSGFPSKGDVCFDTYDNKYRGKEYYDPRFSGWYAVSMTAKADDRPAVVDINRAPILDPAKVFSGAAVYLSFGVSGYTKGTGGVGGWLNGVMVLDEEPPMGRLDNKPTADQMFADVAIGAAPIAARGVTYQMTPAAGGFTREQYLADPSWSDKLLIERGMMVILGGVTPSF